MLRLPLTNEHFANHLKLGCNTPFLFLYLLLLCSKIGEKIILREQRKIAVSHIWPHCSTWPEIDLYLNLIICTRWSGGIENIHVSFQLIETIFNCGTCLFCQKFLHRLLHSLMQVKVVGLSFYSIILFFDDRLNRVSKN